MEGQDAKSILEAYYETAEVEELIFEPIDARHWGVWHPDRSWWQLEDGRVFITTERIVAEAQRDAIEYGGREKASNLSFYRVRCIEEWVDERDA